VCECEPCGSVDVVNVVVVVSVKLTSEPDFPKFLRGELLGKLGRWHEVNAHFRKLLQDE